MDFFLGLPLSTRLLITFICGITSGVLVNYGIHRLAWKKQLVGPWGESHEQASPRSWWDYLPIIGWWTLRRDASLHGSGYWIRPLCIELCLGLGLAGLYYFEVEKQALWPPAARDHAALAIACHAQFLAHALLVMFMTVATFIDFDERTIPDAITMPATIVGLVLALVLPSSHLPDGLFPLPVPHLLLAIPPWPTWMSQLPGLGVACAIIVAWALAITEYYWIHRYGLRKAYRYMFASIIRYRTWRRPLVLIPLGITLVVIAWLLGGVHWDAMLTAVVGLAFGGGLIWSVRIAGYLALRREAMGFGDVTLMAMIGTYLGWQPALLIFFLSPFAGAIIALLQLVLVRSREIAFGPYLCLSTLLVIVSWDTLWRQSVGHHFVGLGWLLPVMIGVMVVVMGVLLFAIRLVERLLFTAPESPDD